MSVDESFDIGSDTRTVDDSYELPFHFTGTIDKLTFNLGPSQLMTRRMRRNCWPMHMTRGLGTTYLYETRGDYFTGEYQLYRIIRSVYRTLVP